MSGIFRPAWTKSVVQAPYGLLKGAVPLRVVFDLTGKQGGQLFITVGRYSTAALNLGIDVLVRKIVGTDAVPACRNTMPAFSAIGDVSYCNQLLNNGAGYAAGSQSLAFDGQAYSTAFAHGDTLCLWGVTAIPSANGLLSAATLEPVRCSSGTSTPLVPDAPTAFAHVDNEYITAGNCWSPLLAGGSQYELIFDPDAVTTASAVFACAANLHILEGTEKAAT